jgi:lipid II:glycine glycyltransferase (peptidoglycan interpeptide bridge formation enzyme)
MADVLHNEYASRRGLRLRVLPAGWQVPGALSLSQAAFAHYKIEQFDPGESYRTMIVDLRPDLDTIRKQLDQKWRNQLNRAERNGLSIREHSGEDELLTFARLYDEMTARKQFAATDVGEFQRMQGLLPAEQRMRVLTCEDGGVPVAGVVGSAVGRTGIYLLGATNERGMKCKAAYLLQWRLIEWLKQSGAEFYDLGGVNPDTNPGVYHFKRGFGGADVRYVSPYIAYGTKASELAARALRLARQYRPRLANGQRNRALHHDQQRHSAANNPDRQECKFAAQGTRRRNEPAPAQSYIRVHVL